MSEEEEPRPGNFDRAWNDPPLFNYKATNPSSGTRLNKRVGFPSNNSNSSLNSSSGQLQDAGAKPLLPPTTAPPPVTSLPSGPVVKSVAANDQASAAVDVKQVLDKLEDTLTSLHLDARKAQDINKRIKIMEDKWTNGTLNLKVEQGMWKLALKLSDKNYVEAEKIQQELNVNWPSLCTPWLIGIRQLIVAAKTAQ